VSALGGKLASGSSFADLHDVEFNSSLNPPAGNHVLALSDPKIAKEYGLAPEDKGKIWGEGDQRILDAMSVLRELKKEGKIKRIGFSGMSMQSSRMTCANIYSAYPLPTLLRLALLVRHHAKEPVDIIQTYSHQNLQNTGLSAYLSEFRARAGVQTVMNASPLNMGLLTTSGPPAWHPAPSELRQCVEEAKQLVQDSGVTVASRPVKIEDVAVSFGMRDVGDGPTPPVVVGCSTLDQVSWLV
jgi:D-arabinose 1-dehydrogenase